MKKRLHFIVVSLVLFSCINEYAASQSINTITFKANDGLEITADTYIQNPIENPFIILFHQAGWSRGSYKEIAPKLNKMGFNCIAIDQRSGGEVNKISNETYKRANEKELPTNYIDAKIDMEAAIEYVKKEYPKAKKIIIWGSSYSSSLVLKLAGERDDIDAALAFSPGEYFKKKDYITEAAKKIQIPVFITSAKSEKKYWWDIYNVIPSKQKQYFLPEKGGQHGSRALWEKFPEHADYMKAVEKFLNPLK